MSGKDRAAPLVIGHRGLPLRYPHNTLAGIVAAAEVCDMVEIDARRSKDGVIVLSHDPTLDGRVISETDWSELERIDLGDGHHPARLDEVRFRLGEYPLNLEIKNHPGEPGFDAGFDLPRQVGALASAGDLVTGFHWPTVDAVREAFPTLATGLLVGVGTAVEEAARWAGQHGHGVIAPHWWLLGEHPAEPVRALQAEGLRVIVWTVNNPEAARALAGAGVDGIITDDPARIRSILEEEL